MQAQYGGFHKHSKSLSKEKLQSDAALYGQNAEHVEYLDINQLDAKVSLDPSSSQPGTGFFQTQSSRGMSGDQPSSSGPYQ